MPKGRGLFGLYGDDSNTGVYMFCHDAVARGATAAAHRGNDDVGTGVLHVPPGALLVWNEAQRAEAIINDEVERFLARMQTLDVVPTIVSLQEHLETIRQAEIDRVRGRLGELSPEQELAIEAMSRGIVNKIMHTPITTLKSAAREEQGTTVIDVVRRLFNLQHKQEKEKAESVANGVKR